VNHAAKIRLLAVRMLCAFAVSWAAVTAQEIVPGAAETAPQGSRIIRDSGAHSI
jgi:hypothetical protein